MSNTKDKRNSRFIGSLLAHKVACADGRRLIQLGEYAASIRAKDVLAQIGARLSTMPGGYSELGNLFTALAMNAPGSRVLTDAAFQQLAESTYPSIRARATLALGSNLLASGNPLEAVTYYRKAVQLNNQCPLNLFCSAMMTIAALSLEGKHHECLDSLNRLSKLAGYVGRALPVYGFDYLNSVAVELNHCGHKEQAKKVIGPVVASPYVSKYTEWRETANEINQPLKAMTNVLLFPVDRKAQVRRVFAIVQDERINGYRLKQYADAGEQAIATQ